MTLVEPFVTAQASGASMSASAVPPVCPVLWRPQRYDAYGSFEIELVDPEGVKLPCTVVVCPPVTVADVV